MRKIFLILIIAFVAAGCQASQSTQKTGQKQETASSTQNIVPVKDFAMPISNALARTTKKLFGSYITRQNSPVQPEKFKGYHTGTDFETFAEEQNADVPIYALCSGKLALKKYASGYGGVAVESCTINGAEATIIYGHLRLSSIGTEVGQTTKTGEQIGVLGTGFGQETDGERKHLHLGIHKGNTINILGYVQNESDLENWIDPLSIIH